MSLGNRQYVGEDGLVQTQAAAVPVTQPAPAYTPRIKASGLIFVGIATVLLGIWGGIVPFIGPTFGFSGDGSRAWNLSSAHLLLAVLPGAVAFLAGVLMLSVAPRTVSGVGRGPLSMVGLLAVLAGGWFVVGPLARPVISSAGGYFVAAGPLRELAFQAGYSFGPGLLIALTGGLALGWSVRHQPLAAMAAGGAYRSTRSSRRGRHQAAVASVPTAASPIPTSVPSTAPGLPPQTAAAENATPERTL